jgi:thioredoxin-related protein
MRFPRLSVFLFLVLGAMWSAGVARAAEFPKLGRDVFDWKADGEEQLKTALAEAQASGRRVVLMLGANWCPWCHRLDAVLRRDPELRTRWERDYVLVRINVNWKTVAPCNPEILARYRRAPQRGIPVLTLLDAKGNILANPDISRWEIAESKDYDVAKLRGFFAEWAPTRPTAESARSSTVEAAPAR